MTGLGRSAGLPPSDLKFSSCLNAILRMLPGEHRVPGNRAVAIDIVTGRADLLTICCAFAGSPFTAIWALALAAMNAPARAAANRAYFHDLP